MIKFDYCLILVKLGFALISIFCAALEYVLILSLIQTLCSYNSESTIHYSLLSIFFINLFIIIVFLALFMFIGIVITMMWSFILFDRVFSLNLRSMEKDKILPNPLLIFDTYETKLNPILTQIYIDEEKIFEIQGKEYEELYLSKNFNNKLFLPTNYKLKKFEDYEIIRILLIGKYKEDKNFAKLPIEIIKEICLFSDLKIKK